MLAFKVILYLLTIGCAFFFAFLEVKMKHRLTDNLLEDDQRPSEMGVLNDISTRMKRERLLKGLAPDVLVPFKRVVTLKFLFMAIFVIEVIVLQR
jgi:hypothetical protein